MHRHNNTVEYVRGGSSLSRGRIMQADSYRDGIYDLHLICKRCERHLLTRVGFRFHMAAMHGETIDIKTIGRQRKC